ncbi:MAG TPA: hydrogenase maturation nickel metallochaperone HypA [Acidimicrobiia bacterium]
MHELSLAQAIADTTARYADGRPVSSVQVRIGYFRQVVPDSLQFAWELLTDDSVLAGAVLAVEHVPAVVACAGCGAHSQLDLPVLACGACGGTDVTMESGDEFMIEAIDVAEVA